MSGLFDKGERIGRDDVRFSNAEGYIEAILDSGKLSDTDFVESVQQQMEDKGSLTVKQYAALENIMEKFEIEV